MFTPNQKAAMSKARRLASEKKPISSIRALLEGECPEVEVTKHICSLLSEGQLTVDKLLKKQSTLQLPASVFGALGLSYSQEENGLKQSTKLAFQLYRFAADKLNDATASGRCARYYFDDRAPGGQNLQKAYDYCFQATISAASKWNKLYQEVLTSELGQQISLHGLNFSVTFNVCLGSKKQEKICHLDFEQLHTREALSERVADAKLWDRKEVRAHSRKNYNLLVGYIVIALTDTEHHEGGNHKRIFLNIPIIVGDESLHRCYSHTEPAVFNYLLANTEAVVRSFKEKHGITDARKVYAVFLDLHSSYDMCQNCFSEVPKFLKKFRSNLLVVLEKEGFVLPLEKPEASYRENTRWGSFFNKDEISDNRHFQVILNFSSQCDYDNGIRRYRGQQPEISSDFDVRHSDRMLFLHGTEDWHAFWPKEGLRYLEKCTVFATSQAPNPFDEDVPTLTQGLKGIKL